MGSPQSEGWSAYGRFEDNEGNIMLIFLRLLVLAHPGYLRQCTVKQVLWS